MTTPPTKVCVVCKQDCARRPRTKTTDGRYVCKPCADKIAAKKRVEQDPVPVPLADVDPVMSSLVEQMPSPADNTCPSCTRRMTKHAMVCVHCGYQRESGRTLRTRISRERQRKDRSETPRWSGSALITIVCFAVFGGLGAISFVHPLATVLYLVAYVPFVLAMSVFVIFLPFRDGNPGWGIANLLIGITQVLWIYGVNHRTWLKTAYNCLLLATVGTVIVTTTNMPQLDDEGHANPRSSATAAP